MNSTNAFRISAVMGFLAVALGAFGAHLFQPLLMKNGMVDVWKTASSYHLIHAVTMVWLAGRRPFATTAWGLMLAGTIIFSGSLYALALSDVRWLGVITPLGGVTLLAGWLWLAIRPPVIKEQE